MNPSSAACITPNGSRKLSARCRRERPIQKPSPVAARTTAKTASARTQVLGLKNNTGPPGAVPTTMDGSGDLIPRWSVGSRAGHPGLELGQDLFEAEAGRLLPRWELDHR